MVKDVESLWKCVKTGESIISIHIKTIKTQLHPLSRASWHAQAVQLQRKPFWLFGQFWDDVDLEFPGPKRVSMFFWLSKRLFFLFWGLGPLPENWTSQLMKLSTSWRLGTMLTFRCLKHQGVPNPKGSRFFKMLIHQKPVWIPCSFPLSNRSGGFSGEKNTFNPKSGFGPWNMCWDQSPRILKKQRLTAQRAWYGSDQHSGYCRKIEVTLLRVIPSVTSILNRFLTHILTFFLEKLEASGLQISKLCCPPLPPPPWVRL